MDATKITYEGIKSTINETMISAEDTRELGKLEIFLLGYISAFRHIEIITDKEFEALNKLINELWKLHNEALEKLENKR